MEVDVYSWHYTLVEKLVDPSENLCIYFWQVMFGIIARIAMIIMFTIVGAGAIMAFSLYWVFVFGIPLHPSIALVSGFVNGLALYSLAVATLYETEPGSRFMANYRKWMNSKAPARKNNSLLVEYLRAKKEKVCPRIEFYNSKVDEL